MGRTFETFCDRDYKIRPRTFICRSNLLFGVHCELHGSRFFDIVDIECCSAVGLCTWTLAVERFWTGNPQQRSDLAFALYDPRGTGMIDQEDLVMLSREAMILSQVPRGEPGARLWEEMRWLEGFAAESALKSEGGGIAFMDCWTFRQK